MIKSFDWSRTALGPKADWPPAMRAIVDSVALSPLPAISLWGPEGLLVCNEAFAQRVGEFPAGFLGHPLFDAWPEATDAMRPILDAGLKRQPQSVPNLELAVRWGGQGQLHRFYLRSSPLIDDAGSVLGVLCLLLEPHAPIREQSDEDRHPSQQSLLLKVADGFRFALTRNDVMAMALIVISQETGAILVGHADVDLLHDEAIFEDGGEIPGVNRKTGTQALADLVPGEAATLYRGLSVVIDSGAGARLVVPLVREGRLRSLFLAERDQGRWMPADISLLENVAGRAWEAIERVQAAATLRSNQARQGFLLVLGDRLRELEDSDEIMEVTAQSLGRHLKACRAGYGEVSAHNELMFDTGWSDGSVPPLVGHLRLEDLGDPHLEDLKRGLAATFQPGTTPEATLAVIAEGLRTLLAVPLIRDGKLRGALLVGSRTERDWSADEVALVGEVAARLWEALERARAEAALHDLNATLENRVTQRTQELTTSEARFRTLFANAPAPIFLIRMGPDGEAIYDAVNSASERFMGRPAAEMVGHVVSQRTSTGQPLHDLCSMSAETGRPVNYELSIEVEGGWRTAEGVLAPLPIEDDDTQLLIGIARDITGQRQAEEQLRQAQKMEAIGQLTGGIAHDFNNLLTGIIGSLALIEKRLAQGNGDVIGRYLAMALSSANRAAALTHRLLAFSRRQPLEAKVVDVSALVVSMDDLLRRTLVEGVVLDTMAGADIWLTLCDPHQLENALLNLTINGRDAMPDGGRLTVKTANTVIDAADALREPGLAAGDYVMVSVADTGTGMPQDVIARAFDPFFTTKPIGQGTGLGLSMIYGFAKQSDGHVKIESQVGQGTTVKIFLPRHVRGGELKTEDPHSTAPRAEAGETVLVVEDDETVRGLVLEVLRDLGYRAIEAADGQAGLRALVAEKRIDLLITDVGLPGMNGRQLAEQARTYRPNLDVLFITGYAENAAFRAGHFEAGMQMMTKPFAVEELATRIRSILKKNGGSASPIDDR